MADIVTDGIDEYTEASTTPMPAFMDSIAEETYATQSDPQMLTGRVEGRLLELLAHATQAKLALDIGTFTGYSALSMAAGLVDGGRVVTCEYSEERAAVARRNIEASPYADRIELRVGPALETVESLDGPIDLVFIDADKGGYPDYFEAVLPKLSPHGLIVLDNMLRDGTVLDDRDDGSDNARVIRELNERLAQDDRVVSVLLSVRDGVTLVRRV